MKSFKHFLVAAMLSLVLIPGYVFADGTVVRVDPALEQIDLSASTYLLEDLEGKLTLEDVRRPENADRFQLGSPAPGRTTSAYWMRFSLRGMAPGSTTWWLDTGDRHLQLCGVGRAQ